MLHLPFQPLVQVSSPVSCECIDEVAEMQHECELLGRRGPLVLEDHAPIGIVGVVVVVLSHAAWIVQQLATLRSAPAVNDSAVATITTSPFRLKQCCRSAAPNASQAAPGDGQDMSAIASTITEMRERTFGSHHELIRAQAKMRPAKAAMIQDERRLDYAGLDQLMDRIAAGLQRDGVRPGESIAICGAMSIEYGAVFMGAIRAGAGVAPLAPSSTPESIMTMLDDCRAKIVFLDAAVASLVVPLRRSGGPTWVMLDDSIFGAKFTDWLPPVGTQPQAVTLDPTRPSTSSTRQGQQGRPKASSSRITCAGLNCAVILGTTTMPMPARSY